MKRPCILNSIVKLQKKHPRTSRGVFFGLLIGLGNLNIYSFQRAQRFRKSPLTQRCISAVYGVQKPAGSLSLLNGDLPLDIHEKQLPRTGVM